MHRDDKNYEKFQICNANCTNQFQLFQKEHCRKTPQYGRACIEPVSARHVFQPVPTSTRGNIYRYQLTIKHDWLTLSIHTNTNIYRTCSDISIHNSSQRCWGLARRDTRGKGQLRYPELDAVLRTILDGCDIGNPTESGRPEAQVQ